MSVIVKCRTCEYEDVSAMREPCYSCSYDDSGVQYGKWTPKRKVNECEEVVENKEGANEVYS
jgi:hypothetical protein